MPKIVIAPDSFKESLSALEVCDAVTSGLLDLIDASDIEQVPIADGGEGTVDCLIRAVGGEKVAAQTVDPLGRLINSFYGVLPDATVVIEVAAASGLDLLSKGERNPLKASSFGTGLLLKHALENGYRDFIISLGGSATNDGGSGIVQALGGLITDSSGVQLNPSPEHLLLLADIGLSGIPAEFFSAHYTVACDVDNILLGLDGASYVFGPQKGATSDSVPVLEDFMDRWVTLLERKSGKSLQLVKGSGAAGGMALPFLAFTNAEMKRGFDIVNDLTGLESKIKSADLVISGEGKIDVQTFRGKTVKGVIDLCRKHNRKLVLIAGKIDQEVAEIADPDLIICTLSSIEPETELSIKNAASLVTRLVRQNISNFISL